jgi:hypothetical protein
MADIESERERELVYINNEMINPLIGGTITGGLIDDNIVKGWGNPFIILIVEKNGQKLYATITADDEWNEGGRIMIDAD